MSHETGDVRQVIERLRNAHANWVASDNGRECEGSALMRESADLLESLTVQPSDLSRRWRETAKGYLADLDAGWREGASSERAMACADAFQKCADDLDAALAEEAGQTSDAERMRMLFKRVAVAPGVVEALLKRAASAEAQSAASAEVFAALYEIEKELIDEDPRIGAAPLIERARNALKSSGPAQPAPSGWQQRIAAIAEPAVDTNFGSACFFCGAEHRWDDAKAGFVTQPHAVDCLWQNALDALPPSPSAEAGDLLEELDNLRDGSEQLEADYIALKKVCEEMARELNQLRPLISSNARPPAPEAYISACDGCLNLWPLLLPMHEDRGVQVWHETPCGKPSACTARSPLERRHALVAELRSEKLGGPSHERVIQIAEALATLITQPDAKDAIPPAPDASPERFCECIGAAGHPDFIKTHRGRSVCVHCDLPRPDASPAKEERS